MKAIYFEKGGTSDVLHYGNINTQARRGNVLVHIKTAGVNPIDCKIRAAPDRFPISFPVIPGCDGAGIVEAVDDDVAAFKPGDEVYFSQPGFNQRQAHTPNLFWSTPACWRKSRRPYLLNRQPPRRWS